LFRHGPAIAAVGNNQNDKSEAVFVGRAVEGGPSSSLPVSGETRPETRAPNSRRIASLAKTPSYTPIEGYILAFF